VVALPTQNVTGSKIRSLAERQEEVGSKLQSRF